jgi:hypothetical protein
MSNGARNMDVAAYIFAVNIVGVEQCQVSTHMGIGVL